MRLSRLKIFPHTDENFFSPFETRCLKTRNANLFVVSRSMATSDFCRNSHIALPQLSLDYGPFPTITYKVSGTFRVVFARPQEPDEPTIIVQR